MTLLCWLFWISAGLLVYCYAIYPCMLFAMARFFPHPVLKGAITPSVTILIPAHNEQKIIRQKIDNTLSLDYPRDKVDILVVSDGSTDDTALIAGSYSDRGVSLLSYPERRGKVPALLDALKHASGEIVVFSDASGMLGPEALREMASDFADPRVGCVCGYYRSSGLEMEGKHGELAYWGYEFSLKKAESRFWTLLGATGAMYAARRELIVAPPLDTINDDFVIPARITLRGFRTVLESGAVVDDYDPHMGNFRSRVRVAAGNWQQMVYLKGLLSPARPLVCWQFISHKLIRMLTPVLVLLLLASLISVAPLCSAAVLCVLAAAASPLGKLLGKPRVLIIKGMEGCAASLWGMVIFIFNRRALTWK